MIIAVNKPLNWTSNDVINAVKKKLNIKKIGHEGTLDPFATGLLILFLNNATKIIPYIDNKEKEYRAVLKLGEQTASGDLTTAIIKKVAVPDLTKEQIESVLISFLGESWQIPPMYSAKKIKGMRLYQLARTNVSVKRQPQAITITNIALIAFGVDWIEFSVTVSKGTYIRTLGEDIAAKLNTVGHLTHLVRTRIGAIDLTNAVTIDHVNEKNLIKIKDFLPYYHYVANEEELKKVLHGHPLDLKITAELVLILDKEQEVALYRRIDGLYHCQRGLWS